MHFYNVVHNQQCFLQKKIKDISNSILHIKRKKKSQIHVKSEEKTETRFKSAINKNPQFLSNHYETL